MDRKLPTSAWQMDGILVCFLCGCDKHHDQTQQGEESISLVYSPSSEEVPAGAQSRNLEAGAEGDHGGMLLNSMTLLPLFLIQPRPS